MSSVSKSAGAVPVHKSKAKAAQTRRGLLYALPDWLMIIVLFFVPIVLLVVMACSRWSLLGGNRGVNFPDNFVKVFENKLFWPSIWFTLEYTVIVTVFLLVLGLGMAMIVQESSKWNNVLRTCFLLPSATGLASASLLFYALYSPQVGPVTKILSSLGLMQEGGSVLATGQSALWATIIVIVWRFSGYYMLLMMIGLQAIPGDLYEAARMDGARAWDILVKINLPMAMPIVVVYFIVGFIGNWNDYSTMLVYMESYPTLSSGLYLFEASRTYAGPPVYFAAIFISAIPAVTLFLIFNKSLVQNLTIGGLKG